MMASPTSTAWLTLETTTWFRLTPQEATVYPATSFTCPDFFFGDKQHDANIDSGSGRFHIGSPAHSVNDFIAPSPLNTETSTSFNCSYRIAAETGAASGTPSQTSKASTTSNTAAHSTPSHAVTHTRTNAGAIVGAAIGAALLGLLVGALIGYFCLGGKRRRRRGTIDPRNEATVMTTFLPSAPPLKERSSSRDSVHNEALLSSARAGGIRNVLSSIGIHEGASDEEIKSELSALGYLLQEHVQNNYHLEPLDGNRSEPFRISQALADPAFGLDDRNQALIFNLSKDPQTRFAALRHFLALTIFSALDLHHVRSHPGSVSLLPRQVTSFLESIPSAGMGKNGMTPQTATALNLWRRLSAYLLLDKPSSQPISPSSPTSPTNNPPSEDHRCSSTTIRSPNNQTQTQILSLTLTPPSTITAQVTTLRASLNKFLGIFVHSDRRAIFDQERNLEGVIQECVSFGYLLFAHACEWRFVFDAAGKQEDEDGEEEDEMGGKKGMRLLVLPGLEKLGDGKGEVYEVPKKVVEGESVVV
ncbi:hypothetical protein B0T20DRAFT_31795 [Sordaria brevicollis]|uniref:Uncharacterized protein n=1 Tax=Sordaria brevicollis TaxID=83679 RepID=A0AAE0P8I6_SORBR|nr:hypothetical protein B0T20DRAFT_31795 [Sordaria brevicollis]